MIAYTWSVTELIVEPAGMEAAASKWMSARSVWLMRICVRPQKIPNPMPLLETPSSEMSVLSLVGLRETVSAEAIPAVPHAATRAMLEAINAWRNDLRKVS